jgi:hypothetical protein
MTEEKASIELQTRLKRTENILFSEIDQDKVMIDIERGTYFGLNPVAGDIWELLEKTHSAQELIAKLLESYEVAPETCKKETLQVLQRMSNLNLVEIVT